MKEIGKHKTGEIIEYECICGETFWKHSKLVKEIVCPKCRKNKDGIFSCIGCRYFNGHQIDEDFTENTFCTHKENKNNFRENSNAEDCPIIKNDIGKYLLMKKTFKEITEESSKIEWNKIIQESI